MKYAMHVRKIRADEGGLLRQMRIAALTEAPYAFGSRLEDTQAQPLASFESAAAKHADSEVSTTFFAFDGVNAVGLIGAFRETSPPQRCFICSLWLAPGYRGTAFASELVHTACTWLHQRFSEDIFAWVADANPRAMAFYRKSGFIPAGECQPLPSTPSASETLLRLGNRRQARRADGCSGKSAEHIAHQADKPQRTRVAHTIEHTVGILACTQHTFVA